MKVTYSKLAEKQIKKIPKHIHAVLKAWASLIEEYGIEYVQKIPGHKDKLLSGQRQGQRCARLNRSWRVFYTEQGEIIEIEEVNKHEY